MFSLLFLSFSLCCACLSCFQTCERTLCASLEALKFSWNSCDIRSASSGRASARSPWGCAGWTTVMVRPTSSLGWNYVNASLTTRDSSISWRPFLPEMQNSIGFSLFTRISRVTHEGSALRLPRAWGLPYLPRAQGLPHLLRAQGLPHLLRAQGLPNLLRAQGLPRVDGANWVEMLLRIEQEVVFFNHAEKHFILLEWDCSKTISVSLVLCGRCGRNFVSGKICY